MGTGAQEIVSRYQNTSGGRGFRGGKDQNSAGGALRFFSRRGRKKTQALRLWLRSICCSSVCLAGGVVPFNGDFTF